MPELPEVETMRRGILATTGRTIRRVSFPRCRYRPILVQPSRPTFRRRSEGLKILDVGRRGKRVVLSLSGQRGTVYRMVFEPRMTGLLLISDPPDKTHLRLCLELTGGGADRLWFWDRRGLGTVRLMTQEACEAALSPPKLGPDALDVSAKELQEHLGRSQRAIKVALLDQRTIAGVGNLYASEILHVAGVSPQRRCSSIEGSEWQRIRTATRKVLRAAIKYEGSTLGDGTYRNALNQDGSFQNHHRVYNKTGERCMSCGQGIVRRIVQAQRSTFFCSKCQS